jgi:protein-disulfide isomerase
VRIVFKHHPLDFHKNAPLAHLASIAADEQGKFWEFHDKIFANPKQLAREQYVQYARELGLDMKRFEESLNSAKGKSPLDADKAETRGLGATGTPAFFVNGRFLSGAKPFQAFADVINSELTRLKLPIPEAARAPAAGAAGGAAGS